jgi:PAS domain S-box-containing protein
MKGIDFQQVFHHLDQPALVIEIAVDSHQFGAANPAFFDYTGLSLGDFHKGTDWMATIAGSEGKVEKVLSAADFDRLQRFLNDHLNPTSSQVELLPHSCTISGICFVVYRPLEGSLGLQMYDARMERELSMFFNNSIFGAFFMNLDQPVPWHDDVDKDATIEYMLDHLRLTRINQAMIDQYGGKRSDFIGRRPRDFFEHDLAQERQLLRDIFTKGKHRAVSFERNQKGEEVIFEGDYVVLRNERGEITGLFGLQQDITARHQYIAKIEDQNEKLREIAWFQSHVVRAPLARLISLVEVLADEAHLAISERPGLLASLRETARELDEVISQTVRRTKGIHLGSTPQ